MNITNCRGQATIEFIAILPVLFILFFATLEFSTMFIQDQRIASLSREISNAVYRDCSQVEDAQIQDCVTNISTRVLNGANSILPDFSSRGTLIVAVYSPDPDAGGAEPPVISMGSESLGDGGYSSHYSEDNLDASFVADQGFVTIGEVIYSYEPMTPIKDILNFVGFPDQLYEATIY